MGDDVPERYDDLDLRVDVEADVARLASVAHAFKYFPSSTQVAAARPRSTFLEESDRGRDPGYDAGRVRYFRDLFARGARVDPVRVVAEDPDWILDDGYHRLAGALAAGVRVIDAVVLGWSGARETFERTARRLSAPRRGRMRDQTRGGR